MDNKTRIICKRVTVLAVLITLIGYFGYCSYQTEQDNQKIATNLNLKSQEEEKVREKISEEYLAPIKALCNKPISEITGRDFYICSEIKSDLFTITNPFSDSTSTVSNAEQILDSIIVPTYCSRKITEMTSNELIECRPDEEPSTGA